MPDETPRLNLDTYEQGETDWSHTDAVKAIDEHAVVRGSIDDRPETGSYDNELYAAVDEGVIWRWSEENEEWNKFAGIGLLDDIEADLDTMKSRTSGISRDGNTANIDKIHAESEHLGDIDVWVTPESHDFDDIVDELNDGKTVHALAGEYTGDSSRKVVTDGALSMANDARVVIPDEPPVGWIQIKGQAGDEVNISDNIDVGDDVVNLENTSEFESGKPAIIRDDGEWSTMSRGEIVLVDRVIDSTTLKLRGAAMLSHDATDNDVRIEPITDPLDHHNSWNGLTLDARGVSQSNWPLVYRYRCDGHEFRNVTCINGNGSSMHQWFEDRESWRPKIVNGTSQKVNDNDDTGLFVSPEYLTKHAEYRNLDIYNGRVCETGNNGQGPPIFAKFINCTSFGGDFRVDPPAYKTEFVDCEVVNVHAQRPGSDAFWNLGVDTRFEGCTVRGNRNGLLLYGSGETVVDFKAENTAYAIFVDDDGNATNGDRVTIDGVEAEDSDRILFVNDHDGSISMSNVSGQNVSYLYYNNGAPATSVEIRGGNVLASGKDDVIELGDGEEFRLRDFHLDCGGAPNGIVNTSGNSELVISGVTFANISGDAIRVAEIESIRISDITSHDIDETIFSNFSGGGTATFSNVDATGTSSGYHFGGSLDTFIDMTTLDETGARLSN